jgi:hypothetical protein
MEYKTEMVWIQEIGRNRNGIAGIGSMRPTSIRAVGG